MRSHTDMAEVTSLIKKTLLELSFTLTSLNLPSCCLKSILRYYPRDVRQVTFPAGMCIDKHGNIIICDSGDGAIVIFNRKGVLLKKIASVGSYDSKGA